jgi:hypothetical protein
MNRVERIRDARDFTDAALITKLYRKTSRVATARVLRGSAGACAPVSMQSGFCGSQFWNENKSIKRPRYISCMNNLEVFSVLNSNPEHYSESVGRCFCQHSNNNLGRPSQNRSKGKKSSTHELHEFVQLHMANLERCIHVASVLQVSQPHRNACCDYALDRTDSVYEFIHF